MARMSSVGVWQYTSGLSPGTLRSSESRTAWWLPKKERDLQTASEGKTIDKRVVESFMLRWKWYGV